MSRAKTATRATSSLLRATLLAAALTLASGPAQATLERARAAQARGDLRTAQIELRNAVRAAPQDAALRVALAQVSLEMGDFDTAERESRAALERGADRAATTALLIRAQLGLNRAREVLREFPAPAAGTPPALAAQILAGRSMAQAMLGELPEARQSAEAAVRAAPDSVEAQLMLSALLVQAGDRAAAEAAVDRALQADANAPQALMRKAAFQFERGEFAPAVETLGRVTELQPFNALARLQRAEALIRLNEDARARAELDVALRLQPSSPPGLYMRALLAARAQDWRAADEALSRLGPNLPNLPDALLLQASVKRQLNQIAQAIDAAQRHVARNPDDPRGARLLAGFELEQGRAAAAAATLENVVSRGRADAETFDLLGRAQIGAGRPREAAEAFRRAVEAQPGNAVYLARLAAARFAIGDLAGMSQAAQASLDADANAPGARLMLGLAALGRGDAAQAEAELGRLDAEQRHTEAARVLAGMIRLLRFDPAGARAELEAVLRDLPESVSARLALARVASVQGRAEEAERLLAEVLQRDGGNQEALARLAATALAGGPRAQSARAAILRAQEANPREAGLTFTAANLAAAAGDLDRATQLLRSDALRGSPAVAASALLRLSELRAAREDFAGAEEAARAALAESPTLSSARRQLALLLARRGEVRAAENLIEDGLRSAPGDAVLLGAAVGVAQQARGTEAALAVARQLQRRPGAMPAAAPLAGDVLMGAQRPAEAAEAYAAAAREAPSQLLLLRQANALAAADRRAEAQALLEAWAARNPQDGAVQSLLGQFDLQAGRSEAAEQRFRAAVAASPQDALALNNLAWLLQERSAPAQLAEAQALAERAFFLAPSAEIADTLGWILARRGEAERAVPLLRQAAVGAAAGRSPQAAGMAYRFASALSAAGLREEALRVLEATLQGDAAFPERAEAERLLATLRAGR